MRKLKRLNATRIVSTRVALDAAQWPADLIVMRTASDEVLLIETLSRPLPKGDMFDDPHAITAPEGNMTGMWLPRAEALAFLARACEWEVPSAASATTPAFAQGAIAGVPTKLWLEAERVLFVVPAPYAHDFEERLEN